MSSDRGTGGAWAALSLPAEAAIEIENLRRVIAGEEDAGYEDGGGRRGEEEPSPPSPGTQGTYQKAPLATFPEFLSREMEEALRAAALEEAVLQDHVSRLDLQREAARAVLNRIDTTLESLDELDSEHERIASTTNELHDTCQQLLSQHSHLDGIVAAIQEPLAHFAEYERLAYLLGVSDQEPVDDGVLQPREEFNLPRRRPAPGTPEFEAVLQRVDQCLTYTRENRRFKDSRSFAAKFSQLRRRALHLLRGRVLDGFSLAAAVALPSLQTTQAVSDQTETRLMVVRWRSLAQQLRPLIEMMEARVESADLVQAVLDCHAGYLEHRGKLLDAVVSKRLEDITSGDAVNRLRLGSDLLLRTCRAEEDMFHSFFDAAAAPSGSSEASAAPSESRARLAEAEADGLTSMLADASAALYDDLRPYVVAETHMDTLCELVHVLREEVVEEQVLPQGRAVRALLPTLRRLEGDVQERLLFRVERYVADGIVGWQPSEEALDYPPRLLPYHEQRLREAQATHGAGSPPSAQGSSRIPVYSTWYPTLERTLLMLSKVYRCVERSVFEDLALEAVGACLGTLMTAARVIEQRKGYLDADLFLVKHLLVLREQLTPFEAEFAARERSLDFSATTGALSHFLNSGRAMFALSRANAFLGLMREGLPRVYERTVDSKKSLERSLKRACEAFILHATGDLVGPLLSLLGDHSAPGGAEGAVSPDRAVAALEGVQERIGGRLRAIAYSMVVYLASDSTQDVLFRPIRSNVHEALGRLRRALDSTASEEAVAAVEAAAAKVGAAVDGTRVELLHCPDAPE